jgi:hypothetical protein
MYIYLHLTAATTESLDARMAFAMMLFFFGYFVHILEKFTIKENGCVLN